jgi:chromosome condensin MukBEF complex kleisin-like MukF subunit
MSSIKKIYHHKVINANGDDMGCRIDLSHIEAIENRGSNFTFNVHMRGGKVVVLYALNNTRLGEADEQHAALVAAWEAYNDAGG